jgi:hypothetical protein
VDVQRSRSRLPCVVGAFNFVGFVAGAHVGKAGGADGQQLAALAPSFCCHVRRDTRWPRPARRWLAPRSLSSDARHAVTATVELRSAPSSDGGGARESGRRSWPRRRSPCKRSCRARVTPTGARRRRASRSALGSVRVNACTSRSNVDTEARPSRGRRGSSPHARSCPTLFGHRRVGLISTSRRIRSEERRPTLAPCRP